MFPPSLRRRTYQSGLGRAAVGSPLSGYRADVAGDIRVLILGGTSEASALARSLAASALDADVVTSFAGRTSSPVLPPGRSRIGGFGGVGGLARYLADERVDAVIDATHPFAALMPWNAEAACTRLGVRRLRLLRPGWTAVPGDRWIRVPDLAAAADGLAALGAARVLLTTGRQELEPFAGLSPTWFLLRSIEAPVVPVGMDADVLLVRPPFTVESELKLLCDHMIDCVVTKDSGGAATGAKLEAARHRGIPVVMVDRPPSPPGPTVSSAGAALGWLGGRHGAVVH